MRSRLSAVMIAATATVLAVPAASQDTNPRTETQERRAQGGNSDIPWDLLGLFGIFGLLGLRRDHPDDGYHPAPLE